MPCVLMKTFSHAGAKKNTQKDLRVSNLALLIVIFKGHYDNEGVKVVFVSLSPDN